MSERQWRDALSIILGQAERLDREYLWTLAARVGLEDLVARASTRRVDERVETGVMTDPHIGNEWLQS